jgi:iron complex outermembrane receptor protein
MRQIFTVFSFSLCAALPAAAQNSPRITGSVNDQQGKALSSATISLLKSTDSSLVKLAVSNKSGQYEFAGIKQGSYLLSATSVGFGKSFSNTFELKDADVSIPAFSLRETSRDLGGVTVQAKRPFVETKLDKTIVNVDASPGNAGSSALDVLEKSPGVMVNNDGAISIRGKQGVIVMMDGKPTYLSAGDLANMLRNMPASALDQVEIMTNPSSKYDASGNSGIINIRTKKGRNTGMNGSITLGAGASIYRLDGNTYLMPRSQNSFNFNYRKNKFNFFGNYNPNLFRGRNTMNMRSKLIDAQDGQLKGYSEQETRFTFGNENHTLKLGADWSPNKKDVFGVVASGFSMFGRPTPNTVADLMDLNHQLETRLVSNIRNEGRFKNFTGNLNWRHSFDSTGRELTADLDYVRYDNQADMWLNTDIYNNRLQKVGSSALQGFIPTNISIYSFKTDYTKPFRNGRMEAGVKSSFVRNDNLVDYELYSGGGWVKDVTRSNHFIYEENINAAYVNVNQKIDKWTLQAGLRVENLNAHGDQITSKTSFTRDTTNLFPTAFISYAASQKHTFTLSYGKRINRPNYQDMNPFMLFLDTLSFRQGNIYLRPQYSHNFEMSHSFKGKYITTLAYNNTDDVISQIIRPVEGSGGKIRFMTPDNVAKLRNVSLSVTAPVTVAKWWNMNFSGNVFNNHYEGVYDTIAIDLSYTSFFLNLTNSFTLGKGFTMELSGFYRSKNIDQLSQIEPMYQMTVAAQKQVLKGKGTVRLNFRDPFAWQQFEGTNKYGYVDSWFRSRPDIRSLIATFTYRFGSNGQQAPSRRRTQGSSQDEQNRVGGGS